MQIVKAKRFHHNNLELQIVYENDLDYWHIDILQINTNEIHDMFGMFQTLEQAVKKFNSISL